MCVTLISKVNRQGHVIFFHIFDIPDLENVRIDTKINFVSCLQPEIRKVMQKGVWPWFSRSCNKDRIFFIITVGFLDPENIPMRNIFKKFGREGKNPGGVTSTPPLGRFRLAKYLGRLRVNTIDFISITNNGKLLTFYVRRYVSHHTTNGIVETCPSC